MLEYLAYIFTVTGLFFCTNNLDARPFESTVNNIQPIIEKSSPIVELMIIMGIIAAILVAWAYANEGKEGLLPPLLLLALVSFFLFVIIY